MRKFRGVLVGAAVLGLAGSAACSLLVPFDDYDRTFGATDGRGGGGEEASTLDAGSTDSCASGGCADTAEPTCDADLAVDPGHCGACNHKCLPATATCSVGLCDVQSAILWFGVSPTGVAADDNYLYAVGKVANEWEGGVGRVNKADHNASAITPLAIHSRDPRRLVLHGTVLYWTQFGAIMRAPNGVAGDGGPNDATVFVATDPVSPNDLAVDDQYAFWTNGPGAGDVWRASLATPSDAKPIAPSQSAYGIAVDTSYVYWTSSVQDGAVWRANKDGTGATKIAERQSYPADLFVDDRAIYWTNKSLSGSVMKLDKGASVPQTLAANRVQPAGIVVRDLYAYWYENGTTAQDLVRIWSYGGTPVRLAVKETISDLTVDGQNVFWATGGAVSSVAR